MGRKKKGKGWGNREKPADRALKGKTRKNPGEAYGLMLNDGPSCSKRRDRKGCRKRKFQGWGG